MALNKIYLNKVHIKEILVLFFLPKKSLWFVVKGKVVVVTKQTQFHLKKLYFGEIIKQCVYKGF